MLTRTYGSPHVMPGSATLFFINDEGVAVTCKHVAELIVQAGEINDRYSHFKSELKKKGEASRAELEKKYGYNSNSVVQLRNRFINSVDTLSGFDVVMHPKYDLAFIRLKGFSKTLYTGHAVFVKDRSVVQQGRTLCRLGYPFPEFANFAYDAKTDDILWTQEGRASTPTFPIDGIITRTIGDEFGIHGIELSTPGLRGQSGGPLFDAKGRVFGMQSSTHHLHLGFDIKDLEVRQGEGLVKVSNYPFLHLGNCVHVDVITTFLKENKITFYEA